MPSLVLPLMTLLAPVGGAADRVVGAFDEYAIAAVGDSVVKPR